MLSGPSPYERARAATAMAARIGQSVTLEAAAAAGLAEGLGGIAAVPLPTFERRIKPLLPPSMRGKDFLEKFGPLEAVDALSRVAPEDEYPVLAAMEFAVQSTFFAGVIHSLLDGCAFAESDRQEAALRQVGHMMLMQHHAYVHLPTLPLSLATSTPPSPPAPPHSL